MLLPVPFVTSNLTIARFRFELLVGEHRMALDLTTIGSSPAISTDPAAWEMEASRCGAIPCGSPHRTVEEHP